MKLFKHFKNKPYKFIGLARHSETLDEMVIYEALYENPQGKLWVRPKNMFFETVTKDNQSFKRFQEIPLKISTQTTFDHRDADKVLPLLTKVFGLHDPDEIRNVYETHSHFYFILAFIESRIVGFKLGFQKDKVTFYSWLGAVDPEFQRLGIASRLMTIQHEWCQAQGYKTIDTRTKNKWREMIILNLKFGFQIIGSFTDEKGEPKLILEKKLN